MKPQEQEDWRERIDTLATEVLLAEDGCKEPAYRNLMSAISTEFERAKAEERKRIIQEIVEYAEPYDNSKWLNSIDAKKLINFLSTPQEPRHGGGRG